MESTKPVSNLLQWFPYWWLFCYKCSATVAVYTAIGSIVSLKVKSK